MRRAPVLALLLLAIGCSRSPRSAPPPPAPATEAEAAASSAEAQVAPAPPEAAPPAGKKPSSRLGVKETDAPPPADLRLRVEAAPGGSVLRAERRGDLVMLRRGDERSGAAQSASLDVAAGTEGDAPIVVEATSVKTLETTRVVVHLAASDAKVGAPKIVAHLAAPPTPVATDAREAHACRGHEDGFGGFTVVCRVETQANAASVTDDDASEGVVAIHGATTLARLDLDVPEGTAAAKMLAYNTHGRGVVVRAEASRLAGEAAPALVILSDARTQPVVRPRFHCHIPHGDPLL